MRFFENVAKFFGVISVSERSNQVRATGLDGLIMSKYIAKMWETNYITKYMFSEITTSSFKINSFFIPDLVYMLEKLEADPFTPWSAKRTIVKVLKGIRENTWFKMSEGPVKSIIDESRLSLLKWKPMPKQLEFLHLYGDKIPRYGLKGYILSFAAGGGKTFTDLMVATCVIPPSVAEVKIIISPKKALHLVWEKSVKTVFKKAPKTWVCDSGIPMPSDNTEYFIFNFEQLERAQVLTNSLHSRGIKYFIIVDESHNFADHKSARTKKLADLQNTHDWSYFIWTSGSPIIKSAAEMSTFLKCSDPRFDNDAEGKFRKIFAANQGKAGEIFNHRLGNQMAFIVPKSEFMPEKPTFIERPVKLPKALSDKFLMKNVREEMKEFIAMRLKYYAPKMDEYRKFVNHCLEVHRHKLSNRQQIRMFDTYVKNVKILSRNPDLRIPEVQEAAKKYEHMVLLPGMDPAKRKDYRNAISAIKNIKLKVRGEALGTILAKRRSECAAALGLYCKPEEIMKESLSKTLFFASSLLPAKVLNDHLIKMGFSPRMVYAGTNSQLTKIMDDYHNLPDVNPVIATYPSLSEAVPVTAASTVVQLNRPWRESTNDQAISRANRLGQIHPVTVIEVTLDTDGEPNVSSTTDDILAAIRADIAILVGEEFGGPKPEDREYQSVIDASQEDADVLKFDASIGLI